MAGVGKDTVAECLTLILGKEKALLLDVRGIGSEPTTTTTTTTTTNSRLSKHHGRHYHSRHHPHRREHNPLLTPEHPRYFSWDDFDSGSFSSLMPPPFFPLSPLVSRSASFSHGDPAGTRSAVFPVPPDPAIQSPMTHPSLSSAPSTPSPITNRRPSAPTTYSSTMHIPTVPPIQTHTKRRHTTSALSSSGAAVTASPTDGNANPSRATMTPASLATAPPPVVPGTAPATPSIKTATSTPMCSQGNLARFLSNPPTHSRSIAVLPSFVPDTPEGRAALRSFAEAARATHRDFVGVVLTRGEGAGWSAAAVAESKGVAGDVGAIDVVG